LNRRERFGQLVSAALADQHPRLDQRADTLFEKERVPHCALDQKRFYGFEGVVGAEQRLKQRVSAGWRQRIER
jgi:hypothetical protein